MCRDGCNLRTLVVGIKTLHRIKAVVNTVGGLLASRRVSCWLPLLFFVPIRQIQTKAPP